MAERFDTIVVGGGSAGCVIASRLSADGKRRVLLLEAGRDDPPGLEPAHIRDVFFVAPYHPDNVWPDLAVHWAPRRSADARPSPYLQARVIGGGSSINAMGAIRGFPEDYEAWEAGGAAGWGWAGVLPYFRKLEHDQDFGGPLHGQAGPIPVRRLSADVWPPFARAVAAALQARGVPLRSDMNGEYDDGIFPFPLANTAAGRVSAAMAYLGPEVRRRANLSVRERTSVERVLVERGRAVGVCARAFGEVVDYAADEVILTCGTLQTPVLLMNSGVGPAAALEAAGVDVRADLPGVGSNLQDHPFVSIAAYLRRHAMQPRALRPATCIVARRSARAGNSIGSDLFLGVAGKVSWHAFGERLAAMNVVLYAPRSRGRVVLCGPRGAARPSYEFNLLDHPSDLRRLREGFLFAGEIMRSAEVQKLALVTFPASFTSRVLRANRQTTRNRLQAAALTAALDLAGPLRGSLLRALVSPAPPLDRLLADEELLGAWLRRHATGFFHPVGTCRMGASRDAGAVVDRCGRVFGVDGLRVADASIMPAIPRAPTNLTTLMIAEKIAAEIAREPALRAADIPADTIPIAP